MAVLEDFAGTAFGGTPVWTDVSGHVLAGLGFDPVTVTWGRQDQLSEVSPTSGSRVLLNADGTFTPGRSSSTYYPHVRRRLHSRVNVTIAGVTVPVLDDYADSLTVVPGKDVPTTMVQSGTDILGRFGGAPSSNDSGAGLVGTTLRSFLAEEILLDGPAALYMMQEAEGAGSFADVTGGFPPVTSVDAEGGVVESGQAGAGGWFAGDIAAVTNDDYATWVSGRAGGAYLLTPNLNAPVSLEMSILAPSDPPLTNATVFVGGYGGSAYGAWEVTASGVIQLRVNGTVVLSTAAGVFRFDGAMHHFAVTAAGTYFDGVGVAGGVANLGTVFYLGTNPMDTLAAPFTGGFSYLAGYASTLSAVRVLAHYNAGANAFSGERTDARIARLLSYRANAGSVLDTGLGYMGQQDIQGVSLQQALFDVAAVEGGVVFADGQGRINFRSRSRLYNPTPVVTLDCATGCVDWPSQWREDTQNVINDMTVTRNGGADSRAVNAASISGFDGEFSNTLTLDIDTDSNALAMAQWIVACGIQPQITVTPLQVDLLHAPSPVALAVLQLDPLDCIQVVNCPAFLPASTMTFIVQGGDLSIGVDAAVAALNTSVLAPPVVTADGLIGGVVTAGDTSDSATFVAAP